MSQGWLVSDMAFLFIGAAGVLAATPLLVWALLWDWSRGRARCQRCWHSMVGIPADERGAYRCPECGFVMARERSLYKRRIRVRTAFLSSVVLVVGAASASWPFVRSTQWVKMAPDGVLIWSMPMMDQPNGAATTAGELLHDELWARLMAGSFSPEEQERIYQRALMILERRSGDESIELIESVGDGWWEIVHDAFELGTARPDDLAPILAIRAQRSVHLREVWLEGSKPRAHLELDAIMPVWPQMEVTALARTPGARQINRGDVDRGGLYGWRAQWFDWSSAIGAPVPDARDVTFDILITTWSRTEEGVVDDIFWAGEATASFRWSASDGLAPMSPAAEKRLSSEIRKAALDGLAERGGVEASFPFSIEVDDDVAAALRLTWVLADAPLWSTSVWHCPIAGPSDLTSNRWITPIGRVYAHVEGSAQWVLRIEGDRELARRHPTATRYWDGVVEIPLVEALESPRR